MAVYSYTMVVVLSVMATLVQSQRPSFAGSRPIGYPVIESENVNLASRFGEDEPNIPIETKGDRNLINRLEKLPVDNRPFWYTNAGAYDALRKQPQTWPLRPNNFIDN